ncbi:Serine protease F56F10.1 precursor-related protein [Trichomonas vaginalis G3]|uniref:Serine protease F56F10.1-related protein n=1 Tax=Trichomonas vaginalis (strain ATCC PRA-98 / G3) TaxID=412133 RepID=A2FBQ3_TRIV3|nr:serine-type peptidase protein [Trichomonas vaginalis G3]EAX97650.1 Serine protease F56F10.1 precursor-related protein [Trichomonas vaginalis G3]KAI5510352.1 serine-type peptidase protein [Trichomonas vaginalis G3]|eukprot:XP_001310580.1 Serine protease F56F10.1 precursor-related protein [Trichomonas vaginalis G3]
MFSLFILPSLCDTYETKTFSQVIDHNNSDKKFNQRYYVNTQYAEKADHLIFYLGGFTTLNSAELEVSPVNQVASSSKDIVIGLENRYFGASVPTEDLSTENLKYNTIDQHLEDIKDFVLEMKKQYCNDPSKCRVLTVGRGFGASLATWVHMKKGKELNIVGTWASSAFLLADTEFSDYDHHEAVVFNHWGNCYDTF